jgi:xylulokinase
LKDTFTIFSEMNVPVKSIRLGGGGARSPLWRQIQADVYGQEVEILEAEEGAAYGAAILGGVGAKVWPSVDDACHSILKTKSRVRPNAEGMAAMNQNYSAYRRLHEGLKFILGEPPTAQEKSDPRKVS